MKKLFSTMTVLPLIFAASLAAADPADPADVILSNDGKFNAAAGICLLIDAENVGQCVKFIQENFVSPPACDGNLRSDEKACGANAD